MEPVFGEPSDNGAWLIYGSEKNGKTTIALILANYLSAQKRVLYVSAEEGVSEPAFVDACKRAGLEASNRNLHFLPYISAEDLDERLGRRRAASIIFIDNCTIYKDELRSSSLKSLLDRHPNKLFIFLAHEERKEPYTALAKYVSKIAKVIIHVEGLACNCYGRIPGGVLTINDDRATLYHGMKLNKNPKQ
jgi:predicted ATP-dependent serine protease